MTPPRGADLHGTPAVALAPRRAIVLAAAALACCLVPSALFIYMWPSLTTLPVVRALSDPLYELVQWGWLVAILVGGIVGVLLARRAQRLIPPAYASGRYRERIVVEIPGLVGILAWAQAVFGGILVVTTGAFLILHLTGVVH